MSDKTNIGKLEDLDWVPSTFDANGLNKSFLDRIINKFKENPLIPLGCIATVGAFAYGVSHFVRGNSVKSNYGMRARVGFQLFTIFACLGGTLLQLQNRRN